MENAFASICNQLEGQYWEKNQALISPRIESLNLKFLNMNAGPLHCVNLSTPLDFFELFFDSEVFSIICKESMDYFKDSFLKKSEKFEKGSYQYYYKKLNGILYSS